MARKSDPRHTVHRITEDSQTRYDGCRLTVRCSLARMTVALTDAADSGACRYVAEWPILLQKAKIERPGKSLLSWSLDLSAVASLFSATRKVRDRSWMNRYGPRAKRISGSQNFRSPRHKDFCNNIGPSLPLKRCRYMSVQRGRPEVCSRALVRRF